MADRPNERPRRSSPRAAKAVAPTRGKRLPPTDRRREIVVKAAEFFSKYGFDAGTRDLARHIGLTQPIIYRYFPTKQALIQEVCKVVYLDLWSERWDEILIDTRVPLRTRLIEFFDQYTDVIMNSQWLRLYLFAGLRGAQINELYIALIEEKIIKRIAVECWKEHGLGRPDMVPNADLETVWTLQGGIFYYGVRRFVYGLPVHIDKRDMITSAVDLFLVGYGSVLDAHQAALEAPAVAI